MPNNRPLIDPTVDPRDHELTPEEIGPLTRALTYNLNRNPEISRWFRARLLEQMDAEMRPLLARIDAIDDAVDEIGQMLRELISGDREAAESSPMQEIRDELDAIITRLDRLEAAVWPRSPRP